MRKLIESTFVSLDGVISNPQDYSPPYWDEDHFGYSASLMKDVDAQVLGRVTYEGFAEAWGSRTGEMADLFNNMKKYVASRTLTETTWNAELLEGDAVEAVRQLKETDGGDLIKFGSGEFSKALLDAKLVDEYHFWIFPVLAGTGDRLFDGQAMTHLDLLGSTTFKSGIIVHKLAPKA